MPASGTDRRTGDQRVGIIGEVSCARPDGIVERRRRKGVLAPLGGAQLRAGAREVEIGKRDKMHAARAAKLRQEHGAELAGTDQADCHRAAFGLPLQQHGRQIHRWFTCWRMFLSANRCPLRRNMR
jgi:hypothetical protein